MELDFEYLLKIGIPILALIVSCFAVYYTWKGLKLQREHNIKSLKPIGKITIGDFESHLFVRIDNYGVGPLIMKSLSVNGKKLNVKQTLLSLLDPHLANQIRWKNFSGFLPGRVIPAGGQLDLIDWTKDKDYKKSDDEIESTKRRCREHFKSWTIKVTYTDIYESKTFEDELELSWFGRNLEDSVEKDKK
tara:strand:- start:48233 stop:48802 length:570 start_codon:yes stop_codon:yes gene_type:complete